MTGKDGAPIIAGRDQVSIYDASGQIHQRPRAGTIIDHISEVIAHDVVCRESFTDIQSLRREGNSVTVGRRFYLNIGRVPVRQ